MVTWNYIKPLNDAEAISKYEKECKVIFCSDFVECATKNNGGCPSADAFDTDKTKERTIKALLSFNESDIENIYKNNKILQKENANLLAFAIDSFGNYICFSKEDSTVVFYDFESGDIEFISNNFIEFLKKLYE